MNVFLDITGPEGGRMYILDEEGRLRRTSSFGLDGMEFSFDEPLSEDLEASYVSIPVEWLDFRFIELDIPDAGAARDILPFELDGLLLDAPSEYVIEALMAPVPETQEAGQAPPRRVLAAFIKKDRLMALLDGLGEAGLDPRAVTSIELASVSGRLGEADVWELVEGAAHMDEPARVDQARAEMGSPTINMRRGDFAFRGDMRKGLRSLAFTVSLFVGLMLMLTMVFSLKAVSAGRTADALEDNVLGIYGEIFPGQKPKSARGLSYKVRSKLKELRSKAGSMESVEALDMLMELQRAMPAGGGVRLMDITLDRDAVLFKGEGKDLEVIEQVRSAMESFLSDVKITETGKAVSGLTGFTISAKTAMPQEGEGK